MLKQLPRWVELGSFALALVAGSVNAIALLGFNHQGVSHLSGSSSLLGVELAQGQWQAALHLLAIMLSFVLGAALSAALINHQALRADRRYSGVLGLEALLLVCAALLLQYNHSAGHYLASLACGLQNGMTTTYSGALLRTTHVTGIFTDLGIMLGQRLRGQRADRRRIWLYLLLASGFIVGGVLGTLSYLAHSYNALLWPALAASLLAAGGWYLWRPAPRH
ncbi:Uncharacterized membrane protein YoaK, UPF0700 family [Atopomonas hussainii]|uniref:Uncharacterized membrane protein YoaK, UPF0700 family n=1 Tax=Atopomonas hussainii TaxID=1429083 RepID=A0A1H7LVM9_9GAMM|nr:YoaK family protein [Atopomonas hussainii]SEL02952.1 Uncharacterized membrane protein YoaK, UPF0700 family [Atopomonas hussainii]